jgi:hypothetical protein
MSKKQDDLIADLQETFNNLRKYNMMFNPTKCVFGVPAGQLLGFIVSHRRIEVNPEKIKANHDISQSNGLKDVQRLMGCMAAMSRFISHLGEKALPLYKLMKKSDEFIWTDEADAALKDLKRVLSTALVLAAPEDQEPMLLYMATTNKVVNIVIVVERKEEEKEYGIQSPVYYVSEVLTESKQRYPHYQKLAYAVFLASRKLQHYFYDHMITVVSKAPLKDIINNSDATRRVQSGASNLPPSTSTISLTPPSSLKLWWNSWRIGRKHNRLRMSQNWSIGLCTLMVQSCYMAWGLE